MRHSELIAACLDILHANGCYAWKANTGAVAAEHNGKRRFVRFGLKGQSDILGWVPPRGRFLAVECKVGYDRLRPEQRKFLADVEAGGGFACVVRLKRPTDTLDEFVAEVKAAIQPGAQEVIRGIQTSGDY